MRQDLLAATHKAACLATIDAEFANMLDHESVRKAQVRGDLRRRLAHDDWRLYVFLYPASQPAPPIIVEIAPTQCMSDATAPILTADKTGSCAL